MEEGQSCLLFRRNKLLLLFTVFYITSVVLYFVGYGIGLNPLNALMVISQQKSPAAPESSEPQYASPTSPPVGKGLAAFKSIVTALGAVWWLIGMGAPCVGLLSFLGIWVGVNEKQFFFIRVCAIYTLVFVTIFWTMACGVQVYLQLKAHASHATSASTLNILSLVLGILSLLGTVLTFFCSRSFSLTSPIVTLPIDEEDEELMAYGDVSLDH